MAAALSALGDAAAAARLLGTAATVRAEARRAASVAEQRDIERARGRVVATLGDEAVDQLMAEGRGVAPADARVAPA